MDVDSLDRALQVRRLARADGQTERPETHSTEESAVERDIQAAIGAEAQRLGGLERQIVAEVERALAAPMLAPRAPLDPDTGCRLDAPPPSHTLLLIDATEPLVARRKRLLGDAVAKAQAATPTHGRLSIVSLDAEQPDEPRWLASLCSPGDGSDASFWFANPARLRARWQDGFAAPLTEATGRASAHHDEKTSSIIAALRFLAREPAFNDAPKRRLVLVSDLMEHSPGTMSLYEKDARFEPARDLPARDLPARLEGVDVAIVLIDRPRYAAAQIDVWARFWSAWFEVRPLSEKVEPGFSS